MTEITCLTSITPLLIIVGLLAAWVFLVKKENKYLSEDNLKLENRLKITDYDRKVNMGVTDKGKNNSYTVGHDEEWKP